MATEAANTPDPVSLLKREVEDKEMASELSNITVREGPKEEKKKIESWLSQPPEIIEFFGKTETEEVGNDDEVANINVISKGNVETVEGDVFSKSLSFADEKSERYTEHSQKTTSESSVGMEMDPETIQPPVDMSDIKNKHGSSLLDAPVEETTSKRAGTVLGESVEENMSMPRREASQETVELTEKMKDSNSVEEELPHKNQEASFFQKMKDVIFHKVDNLETPAKESESGIKDSVKESQHEAEHKNEILENISTGDSDQSITGMRDGIQDTKAEVSFGQQRESTEREREDLTPTEVLRTKGTHEGDISVADDNIVAEEQEKTETSTHEREAPTDEKLERYTEHSQMTTSESSVGMVMDPETIQPPVDMWDIKNKHGSSLLDAPVEETTSKRAGTVLGESVEENMSMPRREASQETVELTEKMKDSNSVEEELPHKNQEASFFQKMKDVFFHKVDNLETPAKESESGIKDSVKESQHEAEHKNEILENISTGDSDQSTTGMRDGIQDTKAEVSFGQQRESTEREREDLTPTEVLRTKGTHEGDISVADDNIVAEEQEKTETSTHEREAPTDPKEIEPEGSDKYAETTTTNEERRPVGSPEEIVGEKQKEEMIIADDINKKEIQEANNLPTVDLDEKTRSAELEIPEKSGSELWINPPPVEEEVKTGRKNQEEVLMSESGDRHEAIQFPNKEENHDNETSEETKISESTSSQHTATEGELNIEEVTSTSEMDINTEKGCDLKSEEALKEINAEDMEEEREQMETASNTEFLVERKSDDNGRSTTEEGIPVQKGTPLCPGGEEYQHDQEEKAGSNSFPEEFTETDGGNQSYVTSDEISTTEEQIQNQEVCEDRKMKTEENTAADFPSEPMGECTTKCSEGNETDTKKYKAEASEGYDTYAESTAPEESAIPDLPSSDVQEEKLEESLKEDRREAMMSDKEVWNSNIESRERDFEATNSTEESTTKDLKDEAEANEGLKAQSIIGSSDEEAAQESNSNLIQSFLVPEIIEKEVNKELLEKEDLKDVMEAEETRLTEAESEYPMRVDSSNLISEEKSHVTNETSEMRSNDLDITAESAEISVLSVKEDMEIPTARKDGADESTEKTQSEGKTETCDDLSKPEDQREIATAETSLDCMPVEELVDSSPVPLEEHNLVTEVSETTSEALEKEKTLSDKEETPLVAETTEEYIAETENNSTIQENNTNKGQLDIGKEHTIDDASVRELHAPLELNDGKSISESDVELLKGVNAGEAANGSDFGKLETSDDEKSSSAGVEKETCEIEEAVNEASQGIEVGGGRIETKKATLEQEDSAKNFESGSKEGVEMEKATVEYESEAYSCGSNPSEMQAISSQTEKAWNSNIKRSERDFEATPSTEESTAKDLKDEAEANEGLNAQSIIGSSDEEAAQESNSNLVQSSSVPEIIENEVDNELLEKEDSKDAVEAEEKNLNEAESEYPMRVDSFNLISEEKSQVTTETGEMRSNDMDIIAESAETSVLSVNEDMEIPTARKDGADESTKKTQPEGKTETCDEFSKPEDQSEIANAETSLDYMPVQELMESSPVPLEAHNLVTEISETTSEALEKEKTLSDKEETPLVAETTENNIVETENDINTGSIDVGKERAIDDALVRELRAPLELNDGKGISEFDVGLSKGVNAGEAANGSDTSKLQTSDDEKSSHVGVEKEKSETEEAVNEASQGIELGGGCTETQTSILEQEDSAKKFEGSSKEGVEMEKGTVEFESEAYSCGSDASETQAISTQTEKRVDVEHKELASEHSNVTVNEVPQQEEKSTESWLSQPPETIEIPETQCMEVAHDVEVGNVNVVYNVGTTEGGSFLKSTSIAAGKLNKNTEDDQLNTEEEPRSLQEEDREEKMFTYKNVMVEASYGQDEGVRSQTPELKGGSSRDIEILNEVLHEGNMESITSTEMTFVEQNLKETSFEGEDKKSNALEMDPEATQPSTDIVDEENKREEMPCHGVKDVCMSTEITTQDIHETDEPTESNVGATDKVGSSLFTEPIEETSSTKEGPDICKNLEENSSMACEEESQETGQLGKRMKEDASIEDEVEKQNLESSFLEEIENVEMPREESETGIKDIDNKTQREAENQNKTLENTTTADSNLSTEGGDVENQERRGENVLVEEQEATETSKHEEHSEQTLKQNIEPAKANLGSPSGVASEDFETTSLNDNAELTTKIKEERPVGSPEEILGETIIDADINEDGTTEAKDLSMVDMGEKTKSAKVNNTNNNLKDVYVTRRPVEEPEEDEKKQNEVSMLESEEQDRNETSNHEEKSEQNLMRKTVTAQEIPGSPLIVALEEFETSSHNEYAESITKIEEERPVGNPEEILREQRKDKIMIADDSNDDGIPEAERPSADDLDEKTRSAEIKTPDNNTREVCVTHPPVEETVLERGKKQNEVSLSESVDQVHEASASEVPEDHEKHANDSYEASKSSDCNISEHTCTEGEVNMESTTSAKEITAGSQDDIIWQPRNGESMIADDINNKEIPEAEASNVHGTAPASTTREECSISDLPSSLIGEEKVEERLKEDRRDETKSETEVSNSHVECIEAFDAIRSTAEKEDMALKHEAEANEDFNAESITESSAEETTQKQRNVDLVENSSSVPEICEKEIKEEGLEKEDSNVPVVAEETSLTQVKGENIKGLDSADLVFEEKGLVPTETSMMGSNATNLMARTVENSILGENSNTEIPTASEVATVESSLDDISEQMPQAFSIQTLEEHNLLSPEVGETTGEAPEKDETTYEKTETSLATETTEDEVREIEDESSNTMKDTNLGSVDKEKERANDYAEVEDRGFYTPPEQNIEESTFELETVEELKSSEKDKSEYDTASEGLETCSGCMETEKAILEQEDSAKKLEGSSKESDETEKAPVEFEAETHGSETSEAKSISTLKEENVNIVEHDKTAAESMAKDKDNRRFPEMNPSNTEEERHDDENQTLSSIDKQNNRQHIQEGKKEMNEEMETTLETQEENNGTQDAILTEKVSTEIEIGSERETIKEQCMEEESCTKELHMLPAADGTVNEVPTAIEGACESEIIKEQITEEESFPKELHRLTVADGTVRDRDLTPIQILESTASNRNTEMLGSNITEVLNMKSEANQKEVNETQDAFSTEEVSTETSSAMDEVTYPDPTAIHSLEAAASNEITEVMESKTAQDLNEESEASPMAEVLEDETKNIEKPVDVSSLVSEGSEEKMKGEKIEDTEICDDETDIAPTLVTDLSSLREVQLNDEPVKALDTSSDAESLQTTKTANAGEQELKETSIIVSQVPTQEHENADNANIHVEKSDSNDMEVEATDIPDSVSKTQDQAVKEIHETGTSLNVIDADTNEIEEQMREVPEVFFKPTNQHGDAARDDEITPGQTPHAEKTDEQLQVPSTGLLSKEQESETTTAIEKVITNKDTVEQGQAEVSMIREELETTSEGEGIEDQVQGEENRVQSLSTVSSAEELDAEISKDKSTITKMSAEEVLETNLGGQDTDEHVKALVTNPDTGSLQTTETSDASQQELEETSSVASKLPAHIYEKANNKSVTAEKSDAYDVEVKEIDLPGAVPESKDQRIKEIHEVDTRVEETQTKEMETQIREVCEALPEDVIQGGEAVRGDEIVAPSQATKETSLGELQLNDEHVEAPDTIKTGDSSQQDAEFDSMKHDETSIMVSQFPIHEDENKGSANIPVEKSDANDVEVEEAEIPDTVPESEAQAADEVELNETKTLDAVSESKDRDFDEHVEAPDTIKIGDDSQQDPELDSTKHEETSTIASQLPIHEHEYKESAKILVEKSDANDVEVEEAEIPDTVPESEDQAVKEIHETGTSLTVGGADTNEIEKQIRGFPEALAEPVDPCFDTSRYDETSPVQTLRAEKIEEELQEPSSGLISKDEDGETSAAIKKGSTDKDGTEIGNLELQENSGSVFQLPTTEFNSANDELEEKSDAYEVELNKTKTLEAVSESKDRNFEAIHEIRTLPATEDTETDKVEDEIKVAAEKTPDFRYKGADVTTDGENLDHPLPVGKLEEQIQLSSSSYESTKEDATELNKTEVEEATDMLSKLPKTEHRIRHVDTTIEKSEADEVQVEEAKTSEAVFESKGDGFEEFKEIGSSSPVEKTCTDEGKEETKAVPEIIFKPTYQGAQTANDMETAIDQSLTPQEVEQLQEPKSTTEKPCLQDEGQRKLEVSNLQLKLEKDSQDISPEEVYTGLEKGSTGAPSVNEERPIQHSSQEASTDEDIVDSKNSNKDVDNLPTPYPTVTEPSREAVGGKYKEASDLKFEKNGKVLVEPVSAINSPAVPLTSEGIEVIEETPKENTTELGDAETEEEAIEKYTLKEKVSEEMQGSRNFDQISLQEETATKTNQRDELRAEDNTEERTNTKFNASRNEIQHEMVFKESEEDCADKNTEEAVTADDKGPHQVSAGDEIANVDPPGEAKDGQTIQKTPNQSGLKSHGDETEFTDTATEATAQIEELKSSEEMLVSHEVERIGDNDEETMISKDGQLLNTALAVSLIADVAAEKAPHGKEFETYDDFSEPALEGPTRGCIEPYEHKKETATAGTIKSESPMDNEKLGHKYLEPGCEGTGGTEEKMDKEPVELSATADEAKLDENKIQTITAIEEEESPQENEKPNVFPHIKDSEKEVSHEAVTMNVSEDIEGLEKTSLAIPHEQIASKTDPSVSIERSNPAASEGMEFGEENRMDEQSEEKTEESQMIESAKMSLSDLMQRSAKPNLQVVEDTTEERELMGNEEERQNETAETVEAEEAAVHEGKDEEGEGDELKRDDSGSDAPVMVEASRDMDVKIAHKKSHHLLSGVGSKVKHSLAKVKKAITGKSSHPKPTSPK